MSAKTLDKLIKLDPTKGTKQNSDKISKTKNFHFSYVSFFHRSHRAPLFRWATAPCNAMRWLVVPCEARRGCNLLQCVLLLFQWVLSPVGVI